MIFNSSNFSFCQEILSHQDSAFNKIIITLGVVICALNFLSLWLAYKKFTSKRWRISFKGTPGMILEFSRSCIMIPAVIFLITQIFPIETKHFFGFGDISRIEKSFLNHVYMYALLLFIFGMSYMIVLHFFKGHKQLSELDDKASRSKKNSIEYYRNYKRPYRYYFIYSFNTFILIGITTVSVLSYAFLRRRHMLLFYRNEIIDAINNIQPDSVQDFFVFYKSFIENIICISGQYARLYLLLFLLILFELKAGWITLSHGGGYGTIIGFVLTLVALILTVLVGFFYYESLYNIVSSKLTYLERIDSINSSLVEQFQDRYNSRQIFFQTINRNLAFYLCFIVIFFTAKPFLKRIDEYVKTRIDISE